MSYNCTVSTTLKIFCSHTSRNCERTVLVGRVYPSLPEPENPMGLEHFRES